MNYREWLTGVMSEFQSMFNTGLMIYCNECVK